jgi:hypothetical protein
VRACTVLTTVVLTLALLAPPPAGAAAARSRSGIDVYYVQVGSGLRAWPVRFGVRYVDRYTGSALRMYPSTRCLRGKHFTAPEARFLAAR